MYKLIFILASLITASTQAAINIELLGEDSNRIDISAPVEKTIQVSAVGASYNISRKIRVPNGVSTVSDNCSLQSLADGESCQVVLSFDKNNISESSGVVIFKYQENSGEIKISNFNLNYIKETGNQLEVVFGAVNNEVTFDSMSLIADAKKRIKIQNIGNTKTGQIGKIYNQMPKGMSIISNDCEKKELEPLDSCYLKIRASAESSFAGSGSFPINIYEEPSGNSLLTITVNYDFSGLSAISDFMDIDINRVSSTQITQINDCILLNPENKFSCFYESTNLSGDFNKSEEKNFCLDGFCYTSFLFHSNTVPLKIPVLVKSKDRNLFTTNFPIRANSSNRVYRTATGTQTWYWDGAIVASTGVISSVTVGDSTYIRHGEFNEGPGFSEHRISRVDVEQGDSDIQQEFAGNLSISSPNEARENVFIYEENDISVIITNTSNNTGVPLDLNSLMKVSSNHGDVSFKEGSCDKKYLGPSESCELVVTIKPNRFQTGSITYPVNISLPGIEQSFNITADNIVRREGVFDEDYFGHALFQ